MLTEKGQNFYCEKCDYICYKKNHYDRHCLTSKHLNVDKMLTNVDTKGAKKGHMCECGKKYSYRQSLSVHKKICTFGINEYEFNKCMDITDSNIIVKLIKQNDEFKNMLIDQNKLIVEQNNKLINICKNGTIINNSNNTNTNCNNKTFNLNLFLNETCKDAMNIMDFVDSLKLQLSDLENMGKIGFVEGISNIIIKNLKAMDIHLRPVHCGDLKREVMYVKDENKWEKENQEKNKLRKVIKKIAHKNSKLILQFKEKHPDCGKSISKYSDQFNKLVIEAMGGQGDNDSEKEDKIIRNIAKVVVIDKSL